MVLPMPDLDVIACPTGEAAARDAFVRYDYLHLLIG